MIWYTTHLWKMCLLCRVALGTSGEVLSEYCILKPISFHLQVKRNLSVKLDDSTPDVAMQGCIETAEVTY